MIKFKLNCKKCSNTFDSWFSSSKEFEKLKKLKLINCNKCNSLKIDKSIMSPSVSSNKKINYERNNIKLKNIKSKIKEFQIYIKNNFENVGDNFSKKVREIYYDKKNNKTIYGTTTQKEREELSDEGIDLLSIPWVDKEN